MLGIGIDTGGTCTDAALYEGENRTILASAKTETTRPDLKTGIINALKQLPEALLHRADYVALSTTLATNACVEGKGGRAGLILINAHPKVVERNGPVYGLPPRSELCLLRGREGRILDEAAFREELREKFRDCGGMAVVQLEPESDGGALERRAARIAVQELGVPCVLGHTLFRERNILRRGASALLNARLLPLMKEFLEAIEAALFQLGIHAPVMIVRSDGTLMSREFAAERPVETLLCGPAASVIGGQHLAEAEQALIVDMGGTTTDVSVVRDGFPVSAEEGVQIGSWKTMVHGVDINTFALGGDTRVFYEEGQGYQLDRQRCLPLCALSARYPGVKDTLRALLDRPYLHTLPLHEHFLLIRPPKGECTREELRLCQALENGPLSLQAAADAAGLSPYVPFTDRLEREGYLLRAGVTPTDVMHLRGDYTAFDREGAELAAASLARMEGVDVSAMGARIHALVVERLYQNLARILIQRQGSFPKELTEGRPMDALVRHCYQRACSGEDSFADLPLRTWTVLVGVGAPTHLYLSEVADLLGTRAVLPEYASTANALGAAVSCIAAEVTLELLPKGVWGGPDRYQLTGCGEPKYYTALEEAVSEGRKLAEELAGQEARRRGALGELAIRSWTEERRADAYDSSILVGVNIHARARAVYASGAMQSLDPARGPESAV